MYNFCTLCDHKYLKQGLLMYESLKQHTTHEEFLLHWLCLDEETYQKVSPLPYILAYHYGEMAEAEDLTRHRETHSWEEHCWALGSYFTWWLRSHDVGDLLYIDADIYFYNNTRFIYDSIGSSSIGIITHRFLERRVRKVGHYNVGIIYFADDDQGNEALDWWKTVVITTGHEWEEEYGTCGDQKYLELFEVMFENGCVIDDKIGHAAPWNAYCQELVGNYIIWKGKKQIFIFYHFSHFSLNYQVGGLPYRTNRHGEWTPEVDREWAKELYDEYYTKYIKL